MLGVEADLRSKLARSRLVAGLALVGVYVVAGRLGLLLAVPPGYATAIFPPAGIAMAGMFLGGGVSPPFVFLRALLLPLWGGGFPPRGRYSPAGPRAPLPSRASFLAAALRRPPPPPPR